MKVEHIYTRRDSATTVLRKLGIPATDYNRFITKVPEGYNLDLDGAKEYAQELAVIAEKARVDTVKAEAKATKPNVVKANRRQDDPTIATKPKHGSISAFMRGLILEGKSNAEVWSAAKATFPNLSDDKKHYPTWFRCEMKRKGMLSDAQ